MLIIHPETKEQLAAYPSLAKAFKNHVMKKKEKDIKNPYNPEFLGKILESKKNFTDGKFTVIKT